jgi:hypothetical protein
MVNCSDSISKEGGMFIMKKAVENKNNCWIEVDFNNGYTAKGEGFFLDDGSFFVYIDSMEWKKPHNEELFYVSDLKEMLDYVNHFQKDDVVKLLFG